MDIARLRIGDRVRYQPEHYGPDQWENGLIKVIDTDRQKKSVWVVYNCSGNWDRYADYTGALTNLRDLKLGWKHAPG